MSTPYAEIESIEQVVNAGCQRFVHCAFQEIDFTKIDERKVCELSFVDCIFMGCEISPLMHIGEDCVVLTALKKPYRQFRAKMYSPGEL